jgi:hypothetical protein
VIAELFRAAGGGFPGRRQAAFDEFHPNRDNRKVA